MRLLPDLKFTGTPSVFWVRGLGTSGELHLSVVVDPLKKDYKYALRLQEKAFFGIKGYLILDRIGYLLNGIIH